MAFYEDPSGVDRNLPAVAAGANNGTTPPAPILLTNSSDERGKCTFGSGGTPAPGAQVVVTFVRSVDPARLPVVQITPLTTALAALDPAVTVTSTGFTINTADAPAASQASNVYGFGWVCVY